MAGPVAAGPAISSVVLEGKKKTIISGIKFGSAPRVLINDTDQSDYINSVSDTEIRLKGKTKKLGIKSGDNTIQVIDASGAESNRFIVRL